MRITRFGAGILAAVILAASSIATPVVAGEPTDASSAFERLRSMNGTWRGETCGEGEEATAEAAAMRFHLEQV